jgi:hypothetical protein
MRARIKPEETSHQTVVAAHRRHFTHDWLEFPPEFEKEIRANAYLEIEVEKPKREKKEKPVAQPEPEAQAIEPEPTDTSPSGETPS